MNWSIKPGALAAILACVACGGGGGSTSSAPVVPVAKEAAPAPVPPSVPAAAPTQTAAAASVVRPVEVPEALAQWPFDLPKSLLVPPGFGVRVWARVSQARFMALAPNGDILVSSPEAGKIILLRERANDVPLEVDYASDLRQPHDMVFHSIAGITYLYIAESNRVTRSVYQNGEIASGSREVVVDGLPDDSTPELRGGYGHKLKNIALSPDNKLYVSIASTCNACIEDTVSDPVRGAIYQYSADGKEARLFARGLRNAEGLDFIPGTNALWVTVNGRDNIRFPVDADIDGDQKGDFGEFFPQYIDANPSEIFTAVRDGGNYGWPFCNPTDTVGMSNLDMLPDTDWNPRNTVVNCAGMDRPSKGIGAHSAPLGFSFLHASNVPLAYRRGAVVAQHGCWNCTTLSDGYKVSYFPFDDAGNAGAEIDMVTGFVLDPIERVVWGRPVDAIADANGRLLISDDLAGAIYQLYPLQ
jgi:glucose/arabinose dehydrogenase